MNSQQLANRILKALISLGVEHFVVSPGSRNAPLMYELAEAERKTAISAHIRIDERDAGFTALGLAKVSGMPSVVFTTSGTAVANLFPAVLEARHSGVPLLVITADRPKELQGTGSNQTTRQLGIFGDKVTASLSADAGEDQNNFIEEYVRQAYHFMTTAPRGPVHFNIHFSEPLVPVLYNDTSDKDAKGRDE